MADQRFRSAQPVKPAQPFFQKRQSLQFADHAQHTRMSAIHYAPVVKLLKKKYIVLTINSLE